MNTESNSPLLLSLNQAWLELEKNNLKYIRKRVLAITGWNRHKVNYLLEHGRSDKRKDELDLLKQAIKQALSESVADIAIKNSKIQAIL